ncbi:T9SS C-terminal target domain-containing protein [Chryseobacterium arthrosphaerae]|uniref:T9SS type A sorting domain-containing protein n=1 Tax=Chryseobacterium arthrosphaerae TaxID=651561 RepID=UPI000F510676|nr:T9SS type A sorting domain-containing protein [Chryseobacterium arthrosphaerae]AYZ11289.1 T9SS C-terminal target domain-containing protein [Chryseobacterium arthrosphaerae]
MKKTLLLLLFALCASWNSLQAQTDYIICLDNGSTVSDTRFKEMRLTAVKLIERLVACHPKNRYAVVHYGAALNNGPSLGLIPRIYIESDFTTNSFPEPYVTRRLNYGQHFHEALGLIGNALDGTYNPEIVSPQTSLHRAAGFNLVVIVITDGSRNSGDLSTGSYLVNYYDTALNDPAAFKNVTRFKVDRGAKFAMIHMSPNSQSSMAGASIASAGGSYTGAVESNVDDPDYGILPRLYYPRPSTFVFDSVLEMPKVDEIVSNVCTPSSWVGSLAFRYEPFNCGMPGDFNITGGFSLPQGAVVLNNKLALRDISTGIDYGISTTGNVIGNEIYYHFSPSDINIPAGSTGKYKFIMTLQYSTSGGTVEIMSWNHYTMFNYDLDLAAVCSRSASGAAAKSLTVSPNPTDGAFRGTLTREIESGKLEVLDLNGNTVLTKVVRGKIFDADLKNQRQGIYIVNITTDKNETYSEKIIKK